MAQKGRNSRRDERDERDGETGGIGCYLLVSISSKLGEISCDAWAASWKIPDRRRPLPQPGGLLDALPLQLQPFLRRQLPLRS